VHPEEFIKRAADSYGDEAAEEIAARL
jgi:hypothetical protein